MNKLIEAIYWILIGVVGVFFVLPAVVYVCTVTVTAAIHITREKLKKRRTDE